MAFNNIIHLRRSPAADQACCGAQIWTVRNVDRPRPGKPLGEPPAYAGGGERWCASCVRVHESLSKKAS